MISDSTLAIQSRRKARYNMLKMLMLLVVAAAVLVTLVVLLLTARQIRQQSFEGSRQRAILVQEQKDVKVLLLDSQTRSTKIDDAVKRIARNQQVAIEAHNTAAIALLTKIEADLNDLRGVPSSTPSVPH